MALAPLQRIASRSLVVFTSHRGFPQQFIVRDLLECGHEWLGLGWDLRDLTDPYTANPEVSARRHRCRGCARAGATTQALAAGVSA